MGRRERRVKTLKTFRSRASKKGFPLPDVRRKRIWRDISFSFQELQGRIPGFFRKTDQKRHRGKRKVSPYSGSGRIFTSCIFIPFGRKSEKAGSRDRCNKLFDPEEAAMAAKKRGAQPGHKGHRRRDYSPLPAAEEFLPLPETSLVCPHCGKAAKLMADTEDSDVLEIDVRPHRRRYSGYKAMAQVKSGRIVLAFR